MIFEAKCSECGEWSEISWFEFEFYAGYWWIESGPCPQCGESVRVEELERRRFGGNRSWKVGKES